jgi:hypothetical protein
MLTRTVTVAFALCAFLARASCSPVEVRSSIDRQRGPSFASTGDVMVRVDMRDDLPNAFGRADMFGRTQDRGFIELRYMGLNASGEPTFRRRDVDIYTNETTMSQMGFRSATVTAQQVGNTVIASGVGAATPPATVEALPPETMEFALDPTQGKKITIRDLGVELIDFNSAGVQYRVW